MVFGLMCETLISCMKSWIKLPNNINQWITDDADFIGSMIKNATIMKKDLTVATYFPINNLNLNGMLIFAKHLDHLALETLKGRWISGIQGCD